MRKGEVRNLASKKELKRIISAVGNRTYRSRRKDFLFVQPTHHTAQVLADVFNLQFLFLSAECPEDGLVRLVLQDPFPREDTLLYVLQDLAHLISDAVINKPWTACKISVFGSIANIISHFAQSAGVDKINNQLEFVETLKVSHLWLVTGFNERVKSGFDECSGSATENGLLTEEIGFGFLTEGRFDDT